MLLPVAEGDDEVADRDNVGLHQVGDEEARLKYGDWSNVKNDRTL